MAVAYRATGTGHYAFASTLNWTHIATDGDYVVVFLHARYQPSSVTFGGTAMPLLGTQGANNNGANAGIYCYGLANITAGTKTVTVNGTNWPQYGNSVSYSGVGDVGSPIKTFGATASASSGAITVTSGQMVVQCFTSWNTAMVATSPTSGRVNRTAAQTGNFVPTIINDSAATVTFTASGCSSSFGWASFALLLSEAAGTTTTITPAGATVTVTGAPPSLLTSAVYEPAGATIAVAGNAPTLISDSVLTPAAAAITVTGTAPKLENTVSPPGGSLTGALITITGTAPTLTMSLVTTGATITITGGTPSTAGENILSPAAATIAVTGTAPTLLVSIVPGSETLPVTGGTPVLVSVTVLSPAAAPISVTGGTPLVILPITLQPSSASITVTGSNPTITVGIVIPPTPDQNHLFLVQREQRTLLMEGSRIHTMGPFKRVVDA